MAQAFRATQLGDDDHGNGDSSGAIWHLRKKAVIMCAVVMFGVKFSAVKFFLVSNHLVSNFLGVQLSYNHGDDGYAKSKL